MGVFQGVGEGEDVNGSQVALRVLWKNGGRKKPKKNSYAIKYPKAVENRYANLIAGWYKPLVDVVEGFIAEYAALMLRGDGRFDATPGGRWRELVKNINAWLAVYMPTVEEMGEGTNNTVFIGMGNTAENTLSQVLGQFQSECERGIGVKFNVEKEWWEGLKNEWVRKNYFLITSNAKNYGQQITTLAEEAVVNGWGVKQLTEKIKRLGDEITIKKARLIARDQIGKLQGRIQQCQMEEIGLEMYVWETAGDERVRGNPGGKYPFARPSHYVMDGLLCRWDDSNVYSKDGGGTWIQRPGNAPNVHPGQAIQCRCLALAYMPELFHEASGETMQPVEDEEIQGTREELGENASAVMEELSVHFNEEFSYAMASGDYRKVFAEIGKMDNEDFELMVKRLKRRVGDFYPEQAKMITSQLEIAREMYGKNKPAPNFYVSAKEFADYKNFLKSGAINNYDEIVGKYGYEKLLGFAREFGNNGAGLKSYYAGMNKVLEVKNSELARKLWEDAVENGRFHTYDGMNFGVRELDGALGRCKNIALPKDFGIKAVVDIEEVAGQIWGTAEINNYEYQCLAMFDNEIKPFDKNKQELTTVEKVVLRNDTIREGLAFRKYAQKQYSLDRKLSTKRLEYKGHSFAYKTDEFMRMEFTFGDNKAKEYKVGDVLQQSGVFATTPSELHNWFWTERTQKYGGHDPVRFHLKRNETSQKYLSMVNQNDLGLTELGEDQPEEFDFSIGAVRVTKVEKGVIKGVGGHDFNVKEVYVEIVE